MIMQKVNLIKDSEAVCASCGSNLFDVTKIKYEGESVQMELFTEELFSCRSCGTRFVIRYDIFDNEGHINHQVFTGDVNDHRHHWQDNFSEEQKAVIGDHLKLCQECNNRLAEETLMDGWLGNIIHRGRS